MAQGANLYCDNSPMSQTDFFSERTTLYTPAWYSDKTREERELPLSPADYKVSPGLAGERWTVISLKDGTTVYSGIGPVEILRRSKASST